jgi:cytochrome c biogenesis protein CcdA
VFELFQIVWDLIMIRDNVRKGRLTMRKTLISIGFVVLMYGIGVPAAVLYDKHPEYEAVFIAAMVVVGLLFVLLVYIGFRWYFQSLARERAAAESKTEGSDGA